MNDGSAQLVADRMVTPEAGEGRPEQTRARYPDQEGYVVRDGQRLFYELYGEGDPTILLLPTWSLLHSRHWKCQIPYLARHFRVVTFDGLGNGKSDHPTDPSRYGADEFANDALAVMDATDTEQAFIAGVSRGAQWGLRLAAHYPERVIGAVFVGPLFPVSRSHWRVLLNPRLAGRFEKPLPIYRHWGRMNANHWRENYAEFVEWFVKRCLNDPHSTKQIEDGVGWALETEAEALVASGLGDVYYERKELRELASQVRCPVLVIHGNKDKITPYRDGKALARATRGRLETVEGGGHLPQARKPVQVNLALREFLRPSSPRRDPTTYNGHRRRRALYISSPIGLGHAQRDVAIAKELRNLVPDLEVDWLAQDPVTRVLEGNDERIHPASVHLANESHHIESESAEHDLHCFQAWRRMDEILIANFMLFHDIVREDRYDLWIGDEAWELDYYLHENPGEKRTPYVWLTDFVGWLPMADGGEHERYLTADYNAEMIGHIEGLPQVRDRAIFVGTPDDIVPHSFGAELPPIRDWTEQHYGFSGGYITGFDPAEFSDREALRTELGYASDEKVCIVTVGGSGVGGHLLRRVIASFEEAKRRVPELRMIVVTGPRIDPESLPKVQGLEVRAYVHDLYRHLAACDLAVVQGGLTTAMELTANKRPFLYFPLRHHFEQNFHVRHRLQRYGAGRCMDFDESTPELIAVAIADEIGREVSYKDVESDCARTAAESIAEVL
jgi:pimeloyl-ACP methyl ester carboxylesterase/predicted glycosyltransferase